MTDIDDDIDRLYQLDLDEFVSARNLLAKSSKRSDVKALEKPSVPAWAVNQLFWRERARFDRLVGAIEAARVAHRVRLSGGTVDVRGAESEQREATREAMAAVRAILDGAGHPASASTLDAIGRTLEALPHPEANGRLTRALAPAGLEALAGLTLAAPASIRGEPTTPETPRSPLPLPTAASARTAPRADVGRPDDRLAREREARERDAREREARVEAAEAAVRAAADAWQQARDAVAEAESALAARRAERDLAAAAYERARRTAREIA